MVKIVTDSLSDITSDMAGGLGITVVPLTVFFGRASFLDRITITTDEFYYRLTHDTTWPTTMQPSPGAFAEVYNKLARKTFGKDNVTYQLVTHILSEEVEHEEKFENLLER